MLVDAGVDMDKGNEEGITSLMQVRTSTGCYWFVLNGKSLCEWLCDRGCAWQAAFHGHAEVVKVSLRPPSTSIADLAPI